LLCFAVLFLSPELSEQDLSSRVFVSIKLPLSNVFEFKWLEELNCLACKLFKKSWESTSPLLRLT
jgi:hypothetical protein